MKKICTIIVATLLFCCNQALAAGSAPITLSQPTNDPLTTFLITDNYSHTVSTASMYWFKLNNNSSSTCYIRIMDSTDKGAHPLIPVTTKTTYSNYVHKNAKYVNYSSCAGTTTTPTGTGNSVFEVMGK